MSYIKKTFRNWFGGASDSIESSLAPELEATPCPLCDFEAADSIVSPRGYAAGVVTRFPLARCKQCGLVFSNPRVKPSDIGAYYRKDYFGSTVDSSTLTQMLENNSKEWINILHKTNRTGGSVLDYGAGSGGMMAVMRLSGWQCTGIEPTATFRDRARVVAQSPVYESVDELRLNMSEAPFDVVTMFNVLEHVPSPIEVLREIGGVMRQDADLIILVPSIGTWEFAVSGEYHYGLQVPMHYIQFTPRHLREVLSKAGFDCYAIEHVPVTFLGMSRALQRGDAVFPLMRTEENPRTTAGRQSGLVKKAKLGGAVARALGIFNALVRQSPMIRAFAKPRNKLRTSGRG